MIVMPALAADINAVMAPLISPAGEPSERVLKNTISEADTLPPAAAFILKNQLRLRLGALYLKNADYDAARATLKQIDTGSPAAISASLLLAESYRLQGDTENAVQWFLRAAKQYPYRPATLEGLINAALELEQSGAPQSALVLYDKVVEQAQTALQQLATLSLQPVVEPTQVIFPSPLLDEPVRKMLLTEVLHDSDRDLLDSSRALQKNIQDMLALQQQNAVLSQQLNHLNNQLQHYQQQRQALVARHSQNQAALQRLTKKIQSDNFSDEQINIRHAVTQLQNQLQRQEATLNFIDSASDKLPTIISKISTQQMGTGEQLHRLLAANHKDIESVLNNAIQRCQATLKNTAAKAMLKKGIMLERLTTKPAQE